MQTVRACLTTASFRKTDSLFVLMYGPNKGALASYSTISKWLRLTIIQFYGLKDQIPPFFFSRCTAPNLLILLGIKQLFPVFAATWFFVHPFSSSTI